MSNWLRQLAVGEQGQDVVEYSLLVAFVAVVSAALFLLSSKDISGIWGVTNNNLTEAGRKAG
jgi:Flp pilus assembly pilin Flp